MFGGRGLRSRLSNATIALVGIGAARVGIVVLMLALGASGLVFAQFRGFSGLDILGGSSGFAPEEFPDRKFALCRLAYRQGRRLPVRPGPLPGWPP